MDISVFGNSLISTAWDNIILWTIFIILAVIYIYNVIQLPLNRKELAVSLVFIFMLGFFLFVRFIFFQLFVDFTALYLWVIFIYLAVLGSLMQFITRFVRVEKSTVLSDLEIIKAMLTLLSKCYPFGMHELDLKCEIKKRIPSITDERISAIIETYVKNSLIVDDFSDEFWQDEWKPKSSQFAYYKLTFVGYTHFVKVVYKDKLVNRIFMYLGIGVRTIQIIIKKGYESNFLIKATALYGLGLVLSISLWNFFIQLPWTVAFIPTFSATMVGMSFLLIFVLRAKHIGSDNVEKAVAILIFILYTVSSAYFLNSSDGLQYSTVIGTLVLAYVAYVTIHDGKLENRKMTRPLIIVNAEMDPEDNKSRILEIQNCGKSPAQDVEIMFWPRMENINSSIPLFSESEGWYHLGLISSERAICIGKVWHVDTVKKDDSLYFLCRYTDLEGTIYEDDWMEIIVPRNKCLKKDQYSHFEQYN